MAKILFISYSHDSEEHKAWVKKFSDDLEALGDFEILLDQDIPKGFPLTRFMEKGIANADKVLIIGTPQYKIKAESGNGVAFEESIISTEMLNDIDTIKYYPILRSGTFQTSFPVILQGRIGDDMTDDIKYEETLRIIASELANEKPIPSAFKQAEAPKSVEQPKVANVYLSQDLLLTTYYGVPSGKIEGISIGVTVTNMSKEVRYFHQPSFKSSISIEGGMNTFYLQTAMDAINYPIKLEYGQQFKASFRLIPAQMKLFSTLMQKDKDATITALVDTTLGERICSEPYPVSKLVENSKYVV